MILQELNAFYERLLEDPDSEAPKRCWSVTRVAWELRLDGEGRVLSATPLSTGGGKGARNFKSLCVPEQESRASGIKPFFLCDTASYLLGYEDKRGSVKLSSSRKLHERILNRCEDEGARAVLRFFGRDDRDACLREEDREALSKRGFAVFRLDGDRCLLHERPAVVSAWEDYCNESTDEVMIGQCSVTGEQGPLSRLFPLVTGIPGAQSAGASLVSFNLESFKSYEKKKSKPYNASLSRKAAFNVGSALRYLYTHRGHQVRLGNTTVLFWADRPAQREGELMSALLNPDELLLFEREAEDTETIERVSNAFEHMKRGRALVGFDEETRFFVLGLAPNAARLSVRFFETRTLGRIAENYGAYLRDIEMVGVRSRSMRSMLLQTSPTGKADGIPPSLIPGYLVAMLEGSCFPQALYYSILSRMRSDHARRNPRDMGTRAALLKACLNRKRRLGLVRGGQENCAEGASLEGGLTVGVDKEKTERGYVLGRMFAVMEHSQRSAIGDTNATIRDRYIGAASTTPARVFPHLLHNMQNHQGKLRKTKRGLWTVLEKESDEIMGLLEGAHSFPASLDADQQGEFFVGYYQQRVELWLSHKDKNLDGEDTATAAVEPETN